MSEKTCTTLPGEFNHNYKQLAFGLAYGYEFSRCLFIPHTINIHIVASNTMNGQPLLYPSHPGVEGTRA